MDPLRGAVDGPELGRLRRALLEWYGREHRELPWRAGPGRLPDAYHVLVSEAMLQQTRVATVVGYFRRFLEAFPTVEALAEAEEQAVLRLWQGLGYYRRARHLHRAAQRIVAEHGGRVPDRVEALLKLPGVGRYTAGAIASIAHGRAEPVVDGNVARVLGRWIGLEEPADEPGARDRLWAAAGALHEEPLEPVGGYTHGDLNQAVMELGARVCTAKAPSCLLCPVEGWCLAARTAEPEQYPPPRRRPSQRAVTHRVVAVRRGRQRLFVRRPDEGLWAGLWQLPTLEGTPEGEPGEGSSAAGGEQGADGDAGDPADALAAWVRDRFHLHVDPPTLIGTFEHQTTHRRIRFEVWGAAVRGGRLRPRAGVWRRLDRVDDLPLANPQRRALEMLDHGSG